MRTWRKPEWIEEQEQSGALERGYAQIQDKRTRKWLKLTWRNTYQVRTQEDRDVVIRLEAPDGETFYLDAEELRYWLRHA